MIHEHQTFVLFPYKMNTVLIKEVCDGAGMKLCQY